MNDRSFSEKMLHFLNGKGFYIALVLCLAAVGGSGWYLWQEYHTARTLASQVSQVQPVTVDPADLEPEAEADEVPAEPEPVSVPEATAPEPSEEADEINETDEEEALVQSAAAALSVPEEEDKQEAAVESAAWVWPLEGQVVSAFSADSLSYNTALKDWRTHNGVDLSAELDAPVCAAHAGTVISIRDDVLLGKTVTMDLGNGLTASYSNLSDALQVVSGDELAAGDPIGTVGETAAGEHNDQPWLHFSLEQDGTAVDPLAYLSPTP